MLRKKMYTWFLSVFYTRQAEADLLRYQPSPRPHLLHPSSLSFLGGVSSAFTPGRVRATQTGFKIDLYIFIYAHIKRGGKGAEVVEVGLFSS